ncbi:hypothetical protein HJC23_003436 [Cyclotella cryptica]|uniref:Uncharacterized protein n=1 Tax=Cyclotella cryptica TaxID=29204 RepID=A0ABD3QT90_9STRA|eukprot:CCRYP_002577-RA/>CCRYP_002577-RA protein AED:0.26 eAED:0.26 QI:0/-1/0/1/-1/1/1/0/289
MQAPCFDGLNVSDTDAVLDGFEFNLEGENDILSDSQRSGSIAMDFQFDSIKDSLTSSFNYLKFDDEDEEERDEDTMWERDIQQRPGPCSDLKTSHSRRSHISNSKKFDVTNTVDFDPPIVNSGIYFTAAHPDDISVDSYNTAQTTHRTDSTLPTSPSLSSFSSVFTPENYSEALEHLAQTMKRTEESRRQVMLQRALLAQQQEQHRQAEEQARQQAMALRRASEVNSNYCRPMFGGVGRNNMNNCPMYQVSYSGAAGFFSGSRATLTNGLEQSRRQLQMYMAQMNQQTL